MLTAPGTNHQHFHLASTKSEGISISENRFSQSRAFSLWWGIHLVAGGDESSSHAVEPGDAASRKSGYHKYGKGYRDMNVQGSLSKLLLKRFHHGKPDRGRPAARATIAPAFG
jgi:hypothetical protein